MAGKKLYRDYFNIDPKYYAAVKGKSTSNYKWLESVDSKGVSDVSQANMPPYLAVYVWKRIS